LNVAIIGHLLRLADSARDARLPRSAAAGLAVATVGDLRVIAALGSTTPTTDTEASPRT
jgi:hypothetical protein